MARAHSAVVVDFDTEIELAMVLITTEMIVVLSLKERSESINATLNGVHVSRSSWVIESFN